MYAGFRSQGDLRDGKVRVPPCMLVQRRMFRELAWRDRSGFPMSRVAE
jgi:hypothetical protein